MSGIGRGNWQRPPWDGRCKRCGLIEERRFEKNSRTCNPCRNIRRKEIHAESPEAREAYMRMQRDAAMRRHRRRREAAIQAYGGRCACCGESESIFLAVDHVEGGGNAHRRSLTADGSIAGSSNFYRWLEEAGYPADFQLLCHNCNFAKSNGGCPHGACVS